MLVPEVRRFAAGLRAVERRVVVPDFLAAGLLAAAGVAALVLRAVDAVLALLAVERLAAGLRRAAVLRAGLRAAVERVAVPVDEALLLLLLPPLLVLDEPSIDHLPDITR